MCKSKLTANKNNPSSSWKTKLITKEDPYRVHKTLGILCLLTFLVRLGMCNALYGLNESDSGFALQPHWTIPSILLHLTLNASGFLFQIPNQRIKTGYRIWPEYRWHALIFNSYVLAVMAVFYMEQTYHLHRFHVANYIITMFVMLAADTTSFMSGKYQSQTIRDLDAPPVVKFYFSYAQFFAKSYLMYCPVRRYTGLYFIVFISQLTSFTMTLQRKNMGLSHTVGVAIYGSLLCLGLSMFVHDWMRYHEHPWLTIHSMHAMASVAFLLRTTRPPFVPPFTWFNNKYMIWTFMEVLLLCVYLPRLEAGDTTNLYRHVKAISLVSAPLVHIYGLYKRNYSNSVSLKLPAKKAVRME